MLGICCSGYHRTGWLLASCFHWKQLSFNHILIPGNHFTVALSWNLKEDDRLCHLLSLRFSVQVYIIHLLYGNWLGNLSFISILKSACQRHQPFPLPHILCRRKSYSLEDLHMPNTFKCLPNSVKLFSSNLFHNSVRISIENSNTL